jgi:hypothetical protein
MSPTEEKLDTVLDTLHTRDDFVRFVELLVESFNGPGPPWENATMQSFLLALAHAARSLQTYYDSPDEAAQNVAAPNWVNRTRRYGPSAWRASVAAGPLTWSR